MLKWAAIFLVIALVAGILGFTAVVQVAAGIAKFFFILFLIVAVLLGIGGYLAFKKAKTMFE